MGKKEYVVKARVLWFNEAKGYGLVRVDDADLDDIRVDANLLDGIEGGLLRDMRVEVTYVEELTGWVARKIVVSSDT